MIGFYVSVKNTPVVEKLVTLRNCDCINLEIIKNTCRVYISFIVNIIISFIYYLIAICYRNKIQNE